MITITIECQKCETHEAVEVDGVIAIYLRQSHYQADLP